jgi:2'-5' RNA ligase
MEMPEPDHFVVLYDPSLPEEPIASFRKRYDRYARIPIHVALVFPVPASLGRASLRRHVRAVASAQEPFRIRLKGLERSWDHWLFLILEEGNREMIAFHDALYTGILAPYPRGDIDYVPHVGLGFFGRTDDEPYDPLEPRRLPLDRSTYLKALRAARSFDLDFERTVSSVNLVGGDRVFRGVSVDKIVLGMARARG